MLSWISEHLGTIVIGLVVFIVAVLAARSVYRTRKQGGCSCSCGNCKSSCHDSFQ